MQLLLPGHTENVNAIKFLPLSSSQGSVLLSGSVDKTIRAWRTSSQASTGFEAFAVLDGHSSTINCLAVIPRIEIFVSGSADATVKVWKINKSYQIVLIQTIQTNPRFFPLALALSTIGLAKDLILAVAGTKSFIQIFVAQYGENFDYQATLTGHEGWIRSLDFIREKKEGRDDILLASASQDKYIRLWRIRHSDENSLLAELCLTVSDSFGKPLSNKAHWLKTPQSSYSLTFEALLLGHEDWIYHVSWHTDGNKHRLLSASADSSLAIWEVDKESGIWVCTIRLGEINEQKGATTATGSTTGGFWIGLWSSCGDNVVSLGRTGSWRLWNYDRDRNHWDQKVGVNGHTKSLTGVSWTKDGTYLLSTGLDQTTRLHAEWTQGNKGTWHEFARPQIHGYNLNCLSSIEHHRFISGADEKLLRVFDEPHTTANLLSSLCGIHVATSHNLPDAAHIPVLGLSNKVIEAVPEASQQAAEAANDKDTEFSGSNVLPRKLNQKHPPLEDDLARHTLWPESEKLYGHGHEISAVACSHDGELVVSACRASSVDYAVVRVHATKDWHEVKPPLMAHSLTVTSLRFSKDDKYLLSAGRDRQWVVFERDEIQQAKYKIKYSNQKGHSRMILGASWAPLEAGRVFATAGRDKCVKIWKIQTETVDCITIITLSNPCTSVDILSWCINDNVVVAIGADSGEISIHMLETSTLVVQQFCTLDDS